jgi:hypothetical protein
VFLEDILKSTGYANEKMKKLRKFSPPKDSEKVEGLLRSLQVLTVKQEPEQEEPALGYGNDGCRKLTRTIPNIEK